MYTRPEFDPADPDAAFALIERAVFGTLVTAGPDGPVVSHPIFMLERDAGPHGALVSHLAAANEHCDLIRQGLPTVAIFMGDHGYISSSWYPRRVERENADRDNAPTWNFATVHCHGRPQVLDVRETARHIRDCVEHLEKGRDDRWHLKELGPGGMKRRLPNVLGFRMPVERLYAKFKMGQDEPWRDTRAAIDRLEDGLDPSLAAAMRRENEGRD